MLYRPGPLTAEESQDTALYFHRYLTSGLRSHFFNKLTAAAKFNHSTDSRMGLVMMFRDQEERDLSFDGWALRLVRCLRTQMLGEELITSERPGVKTINEMGLILQYTYEFAYDYSRHKFTFLMNVRGGPRHGTF